jgi:hypothetical protein
MSDDADDPAAFMELPPDQRPWVKGALEFLDSWFVEGSMGPNTRHKLEEVLSRETESAGQNALTFAFGMARIVSFLIDLREAERGRTRAQTMDYLRKVSAAPPVE